MQNVNVFLVFYFRLPQATPAQRKRISRVAMDYLDLARGFAREQSDPTFEPRLCLGLARSFPISTRFELKEDFAQEMYMRALYLMEKATHHNRRPWDQFTVPENVLVYLGSYERSGFEYRRYGAARRVVQGAVAAGGEVTRRPYGVPQS